MKKLFDIYVIDEQQIKPTYYMSDLMLPISVGAVARDIEQDDFIEAYEDFYKKVIREHAKE